MNYSRDPASSVEAYTRAALDRECELAAQTAHGRNDQLNRSAFNIGTLIGAGEVDRGEAEQRLYRAAEASGYVAKDGPAAARATIKSGLDQGERKLRVLPEAAPRNGQHHSAANGSAMAQPAKLSGASLPDWTPPGPNGTPRFDAIGASEPGPMSGEIRRHCYRRDGEIVRVKIKRENGWIDCYRVRRPKDGAIGWQAKKPAGWVAVPYCGAINPFDPDLTSETLWWVEGEKDVDAMVRLGLPALTFGSAGSLPEGAESFAKGRDVVVIGDNDEAGRKGIERIVAKLSGIAARVRTLIFDELPEGGDFSDWIGQGGTIDALWTRVDAAPVHGSHESPPTAPADAEFDPYRVHWHGEIDPTPLKEWLVDKTLPKVGTALLSGQWGVYKTFLGFDLSAAIITGTVFAGRAVDRQGGVLWIAVEGQDEVRIRLLAVANEKIRAAIDAGDALGLDIERLPFAWIEACPKLSDPAALPMLRKIVGGAAKGFKERFALPLAMILIDTLSPAAEFKDANDSSEAQRVMTVLKTVAREYETLLVAVDHMGKDASTGTRNSSVKEADVDAVLAALGDRDLAGSVANPRLAIRKVRGAATGAEIPFSKRIVNVIDGDATHSTLVIDWALSSDEALEERSGPASKPMWGGKSRILKSAIERAMLEHGSDQAPFGSQGAIVKAVPVEKVRIEFYASYLAEDRDAKRKAFKRMFDTAIAENLIAAREIGASLQDWVWFLKDGP